MLVSRTFDAKRINEIVNDPSIYPWVCGQVEGPPLDVSRLLENNAHVALFGEHGGAIFFCHCPGYYEIHSQALPSGRGEWALQAARDAFFWMFTNTDAIEIVTRVPKGNLPARAITKAVHGAYEFTNPNGWVFKGKVIPADIFSWRIQDWIRNTISLSQYGKQVHEDLEKQYEFHGFKHTPHPDNEMHDRWAGAAYCMLAGGYPGKAIDLYNRWAVMADYQPIKLLSVKPPIIDIGESVLLFKINTFEVVSCR